jgi:hypothetical protein
VPENFAAQITFESGSWDICAILAVCVCVQFLPNSFSVGIEPWWLLEREIKNCSKKILGSTTKMIFSPF